MTLAQLDAKAATLSKRAQRLWSFVRRGDFYPAYSPKLPKAMDELLTAGLVQRGGRVVTIGSFYVPVGTKSLALEQYPT